MPSSLFSVKTLPDNSDFQQSVTCITTIITTRGLWDVQPMVLHIKTIELKPVGVNCSLKCGPSPLGWDRSCRVIMCQQCLLNLLLGCLSSFACSLSLSRFPHSHTLQTWWKKCLSPWLTMPTSSTRCPRRRFWPVWWRSPYPNNLWVQHHVILYGRNCNCVLEILIHIQ